MRFSSILSLFGVAAFAVSFCTPLAVAMDVEAEQAEKPASGETEKASAPAEAAKHEDVHTPFAGAVAHPAAESHPADDGHGDGHETGLPLTFKSDLALWSLITFVVFLFVMKKLAWGPLISGLDQREAGIRSAIAAAEENQRKSKAMLAEYEAKLRGAEKTVAEMVAEAKRDAERTSQDIAAKAKADVESMRDRAKEDIAQAKDTALAEVFSNVNAKIAAATERVLGRALNDEDQDRLIQEALAEISA